VNLCVSGNPLISLTGLEVLTLGNQAEDLSQDITSVSRTAVGLVRASPPRPRPPAHCPLSLSLVC
jgi:hypothetical protein